MSDSRDDFVIALRYSLLKKGAKQKFSLFFLIIFAILVIILDKHSIPPVNFIRSTITDVVYRVSVVAATPGKIFTYFGSKTKKHLITYNENENLRAEIDILKRNMTVFS